MVLTSTPRVRHASSTRDPSTKLPSYLQRNWERKAERNYQHVYETYMDVSRKCMRWQYIYLNSHDKKKRIYAKKRFQELYPTMMALNQIGLDDHLPFDTTLELNHFYYRLNQR